MPKQTYQAETHEFTCKSNGTIIHLQAGKGETLLVHGNVTGSSVGAELTDNHFLLGNSLDQAAEVLLSGDVTSSNTGVITLADSGVVAQISSLSKLTINSKGIITNITALGLTDNKFWLGNGSNLPKEQILSGDATMSNTAVMTLATVNGAPGSTTLSSITTNAKGLVTANTSAALSNGNIWVGNVSNVPTAVATSGDALLSNTGAFTLATVNGAPGSTTLSSITTNAKGLVTANTSASLTNGNMWIGNGSNVPTSVTPSGDATISNTGVITLDPAFNSFPGNYKWANVLVNGKGLVLEAHTSTLTYGSIIIGDITNTPQDHAISGDATMDSSGVLTLATTNSGPGSTTLSSITTNGKGLVTANSSATLASTKIWVGNGSSVPTAVNLSADATLANTGALTLATSGVTAASYKLMNATVDAKGRITTATESLTSAAVNHIPYCTAASTLTSSSSFTYTSGTSLLTVPNIAGCNFTGTMLPDTDASYNLGSSSFRFVSLFTTAVQGSTNISFATSSTTRMKVYGAPAANVPVVEIATSVTGSNSDSNGEYLTIKAAFPATPIGLYSDSTAGHFAITFRNPNGLVGFIVTSGTTTSYSTTSDYRLKEQVVPMDGASALDKLAQIRPVNYKWKADKTDGNGFLAHELQEVVPEAVTGVKDGKENQMIDYSKVVPLLTAALKESVELINKLTARVEILEKRLS